MHSKNFTRMITNLSLTISAFSYSNLDLWSSTPHPLLKVTARSNIKSNQTESLHTKKMQSSDQINWLVIQWCKGLRSSSGRLTWSSTTKLTEHFGNYRCYLGVPLMLGQISWILHYCTYRKKLSDTSIF